MKILKSLIFLGIFTFFLACENSEQSTLHSSPPRVFKENEIIELKSISQANIKLIRTPRGFKLANSDKIIMFDIFGTYCAPCKKEAPHLMDYQLKNQDKFMIIGLIHFEKISDEAIIENFAKKYNAYYFISNSSQNADIIAQILRDIEYKNALEIPFKVVLKDGVYQMLSDNLGERGGKKALYYLGEVSTDIIAKDIENFKNNME
ncbi:protein disulfide reductase, TlpA family [Candidatus Campylobacter infans]|uniref:Protein disulfide reductase, TlpA family n=1 Tax=Candidatus Campylobacter infans TaxID=2561898 RepID=A0A7H9CFY1_9BACT|nr:TlpA family protein disulfide reductase [Candidatus Campylobacter infans]QLI05043.1 protein disulfide reductase, TlpA family [Candidatus Campylobacter infans]